MCVYGCVSIANFVKYLKKHVIGTIGTTYDYAHWFFYLLLQHGVTALFPLPYNFTFSCLYLSVCLSICLSVCVCVCVCLSVCLSACLSVCLSVYLCVCLSMCLCVCLSVCASVCLYVFMYYVYIMLSLLS